MIADPASARFERDGARPSAAAPPPTTIAEYSYNGLHWRTKKRGDTDATGGIDQQRLMYYSASWQMVEERIDDSWSGGGGHTDDRTAQIVWGLRYIDDAVMRRLKVGAGSYTRWFYLTDAQYSVIALVNDSGDIVERDSYDAYGAARHRWALDVDGDGDVDSSDASTVSSGSSGTPTIGNTGYHADYDFDRDGDVDSTDSGLYTGSYTKAALADGLIGDPTVTAGPDNAIGYCGYVFNAEDALYTVRARSLSPTLGRWLERDPVGYVDSANLLLYATCSPASYFDPLGLYTESGHYYTTFLAAVCAGHSVDAAMRLAYYSQLPDEIRDLNAYWLGVDFYKRQAAMHAMRAGGVPAVGNPEEDAWALDIGRILHSLTGGDPDSLRACLEKLVRSGGIPSWELGFLIHAWGDAFSHVHQVAGKDLLFRAPWGHATETRNNDPMTCRSCPDQIGNFPMRHREYFGALCRSLGGSPARCLLCSANLPCTTLMDEPAEIAAFRDAAIRLGYPRDGYAPEGGMNVDPHRNRPSREQVQRLLDRIKACCGEK